MKRALVIGGSNGIGLALVHKLLNENYNKIYIVDRDKPDIEDILRI
jgi:NAD(P)-dependent dehydrogenase (short-subunit alcohol dehydrogenase family)